MKQRPVHRPWPVKDLSPGILHRQRKGGLRIPGSPKALSALLWILRRLVG
jgi:hypothetical protein